MAAVYGLETWFDQDGAPNTEAKRHRRVSDLQTGHLPNNIARHITDTVSTDTQNCLLSAIFRVFRISLPFSLSVSLSASYGGLRYMATTHVRSEDI